MRSKEKDKKIYQIIGMVGLILTVPCFTFSQYLNQVNETPLQFENTWAFNFESDYLTSINTMSDSNWVQNGWNIIQFKQYDNEYNVITETRFQDSMYVYLQGASVEFLNGAYYFSGWRRELFSASEAQGFVAKFDETGNLLWLNTYFPSIDDSKISRVIVNNERIYLSGTHLNETTSIQSTFLSEIDTEGNILWTKVFDDFNLVTLINIQDVSDGLLLTCRYGTGGSNKRVILYKLDDEGVIQWQKTYGSTDSWLINNLAPYQMPDGKILLYGYTTDPVSELFVDSWMVLTDSQGNTLKDTIFVFSSNDDHFHIHYTPPIIRENDILILGYVRDNGSSPRNAFLACIDFDFNINWIRIFENRESENRLTFLHDLGNDFYLLGGLVDDDVNYPTKDEWFVVVDSMGCDVTECYLSLEKESSETVSFNVYPNPANDNINIEYLNNTNAFTTDYQIIDLNGKIIQKGTVINSNIDVSPLDSGTYLVRLEQNGMYLGGKKVIIE